MKVFIALFLLVALAVSAHATTYNVNTSTGNAAIVRIVAKLKAGDVLNFAAGVYTNLKLDLSGLVGTDSAWITINGFNATIKTGGSVAPITLGGSAFIKILGLTITTTGAKNIAGIQINAGVADIVISLCKFLNINGNGITINANNIVKILIDSSEFINCGTVHSSGGIAIQVGNVNTILKNVANIVINNNVISGVLNGPAISIGLGVVAPQVLKNVIFDCLAGISVVTGINTDVLDLLPRIIGNLVTDISGIAINVGAGSQVVNNIVANIGVGINLVLGGKIRVLANTTIAHNSIFGISIAGLQILAGLPSATLVIVNNAIAVGEGLVGVILNVVGGILNSVATILNNVVSGTIGVNLDLNAGLNLGRQAGPLPLGFLAVALDELFGGLSDVTDDLQLLPLKALANELLTTVNDVVDQVGALVQAILPDVQQIVDNLVPNLKALLDALGLGSFLDPVVDAVQGTVDDLIPDLSETVGDLVDSLDNLFPVLIADLDPLLSKTLDKVLNVLGNVLDTLGGTLFNVVTALGKRDASAAVNLSDLFTTLDSVLDLVLGSVPGELGQVIESISTTLNNVLDGILEGSIVDTVLDNNLLGLNGLVNSVVRLVQEVLTAVTELLTKLLGGLDFLELPRIGRFTIGAIQAGNVDVPALGSFKLKLSGAASTRQVA